MREAVLVTGGTGKTGRRVAKQLAAKGCKARVASRSAKIEGQVRFDWTDATSFEAALTGTSAIYMVAPADTLDPLSAMIPFMQQAMERIPGPLVLLSASSLECGGPMMGAVHQWLIDHAPRWTVLRPTWFMQNFSEHQHLDTICADGVIYSATGDGRVAFIDADDIARVAVEALTGDTLVNQDVVLTGPEALNYDEVAQLITVAAGRSVEHRRLDVEAMTARFEGGGLPTEYARILATMDDAIANGAEDRVTKNVEEAIRQPPIRFSEFALRNTKVWQSPGAGLQ